MHYRAYDFNEVVHLAPYKGSTLPECHSPDVEQPVDDGAPLLSVMFLPHDTPLTCVKCIAIEAASANKANEDDDDA
jgi:hypothetical protein